MKPVFAIEKFLVKAEKAAVALLIALMIAFSALQLVLRLFFSQSILWLDPMLRHMVLWAGFFGAALASYEGQHFALDITAKMLPPKPRRAAEIAGTVFAIVVSAVLLGASCVFINDEITSQSTAFSIGDFAVRGWTVELAIPIGFALMLFHSLVGIFRPCDSPKL